MVLLYGVPSVQVFWKGRFGYTVLVDLGVFFLWMAIFCVDCMGFLYLVICIFPLQFVVTSGDPWLYSAWPKLWDTATARTWGVMRDTRDIRGNQTATETDQKSVFFLNSTRSLVRDPANRIIPEIRPVWLTLDGYVFTRFQHPTSSQPTSNRALQAHDAPANRASYRDSCRTKVWCRIQ
jgi:hypothetical protein